MARASDVVKSLGKLLQRSDTGLLRAVERVLAPGEARTTRCPLLAVFGPPRSGTTLTYQLLSQGLDCWFISNLEYVLYRTPVLARRLAEACTGPYVSDYHSQQGFVRGANAPAEANRFWQYWCDLHLFETPPRPDRRRLRRFRHVMNALHARTHRPFLSGWLAHGFYLDLLADLFPRGVFVRLRRDLLSTAASLLRATRRLGLETWSLQPADFDPTATASLPERVAEQVYRIERAFDRQAARVGGRVFVADYARVCAAPRELVGELAAFARARGVPVALRPAGGLPTSFPQSKAQAGPDDNPAIVRALERRSAAEGPVSAPLAP